MVLLLKYNTWKYYIPFSLDKNTNVLTNVNKKKTILRCVSPVTSPSLCVCDNKIKIMHLVTLLVSLYINTRINMKNGRLLCYNILGISCRNSNFQSS